MIASYYNRSHTYSYLPCYQMCVKQGHAIQTWPGRTILLIEYVNKANGTESVLISIMPLTQRSLDQTLMWSLDCVCCFLIQETLSTLSQSIKLKQGTRIRWEVTSYDGLESHPGRGNVSYPLYIWDKHQLYAPSQLGEEF